MMKPKMRMLWIKWHAYLACFFLPVAVLYTLTGALYLVDIRGGAKQVYEYPLGSLSWPATQEQAEQIITPTLTGADQVALPDDYFTRPGKHIWYGFKQEVSLQQTDTGLLLRVEERDLWQQFVLIHKGHAGDLFVVIGILLGVALIFSLVSGVVLAMAAPAFKNKATLAMLAGTVCLLMAYWLTP